MSSGKTCSRANSTCRQASRGRSRECASPRSLFSLGRTVATPGALDALVGADINGFALLLRHQSGDFGEIDAEDRQSNLDAIKTGARILSSYPVGTGRVWVITDAADDSGHRASTCLLLPDEY